MKPGFNLRFCRCSKHLERQGQEIVIPYPRQTPRRESRGVRITTGTMVDATIIHAPSSTKNREQKRDPAMHQTRKGKQWYFGMKAHVGGR